MDEGQTIARRDEAADDRRQDEQGQSGDGRNARRRNANRGDAATRRGITNADGKALTKANPSA